MKNLPKLEINNIPKAVTQEEIESVVLHFIEAFGINLSNSLLEISFLSKNEMRKTNLAYREKDASTDVLSFPQAEQPHPEPIFGSILISPEDAAERDEDVLDLVKHGLLHLSGYDHEEDAIAWKEAAKKINHRMGV